MPRITNKNYVICWSGPGSYSSDPNVFGMKVDALSDRVDVASSGPLYRFTGGTGYDRMAYEPAGVGRLSCTDGCGWAGWPPEGMSREEHQRTLLILALKVIADGLPVNLVIDEFAKIPAFGSMKTRLPSDIIGELVG